MNFSAFFTGAKSFYCEKSKVYESKEDDGRVRLRFLQPFHGFHSKFVQADDELLMMRCYKVKYGGWGVDPCLESRRLMQKAHVRTFF